MRLAIAQINPTVGDVDANAALIARFAGLASDAGADVVVFPELCVCGYPPKDLLAREGFVEACARAVDRLAGELPRGLTAIVGLPMFSEGSGSGGGGGGGGGGARRITNSLVVLRDGARLARYDKRLLPTYDIFDEDRYFEPGDRSCVVDVPVRAGGSVRVGLAICEDLWKGQDAGFSSRYRDAADPVAEVAAAGAHVLAVPSASPFVIGKGARHREILRSHASTHGMFVASVNQVGGNDDLIFDGHSAVLGSGGHLIAAAIGFVEHMVTVDIPAAVLAQSGKQRASQTKAEASLPSDPLLAVCEEDLVYRALVLGIRDYCHKTGFKTAIIGLSGGIDSALTAVLAVAALGKEHVLGVSMPGPYSSEHSRADAQLLASNLGIRLITVPIEAPIAGLRECLDESFHSQGWSKLGAAIPDLTEENLQSRARGVVLMAISNRSGGIVLTTGNKSEMAVGYATLYGDMNGGLAVLSDITKQRVYGISRWVNAQFAAAGFDRPPIPGSSIDKPPSAELRPNQTDQDTLPPYEVLDEIIARYIESHQSVPTISRQTGLDEALVRKIARMIDLSEYKRKQAAIGLKVTGVAFGGGRRMPIAQRWRDS